MRRTIAILLTCLLAVALVISADAAEASAATGFYATVAADGSCQITVTSTIHLEQAVSELTFPIPESAGNVTMNGARVRTKKSGDVRLIDLSGVVGSMAGDFTVNVGYRLPGVVKTTDTQLTLELPVLSGFAYPTDTMEFSVTLPGEIQGKPAFSSGYYQSSIERDLSYQVSGATVSGSATAVLKDHETLLMTLPVSRELFPSVGIAAAAFTPSITWLLVLTAVALLYWTAFLRFGIWPLVPASSAVPEGCGAGQLRGILHLQGADLTIMVLQWAQLGYVTVRMQGKIRIVRRMDMGNERSEFEQKVFHRLFSRQDTVDCESLFYVQQCRKTAAMAGGRQNYVRRRSGNPKIFRGLSALVALAGGAMLGLALGSGGALRVLFAILMGILGGISGWYLQSWADSLLILREKKPWGIAALCLIWLVLGLAAGQLALALFTVVSQLIFGVLGAFGGRRTPWGKSQFRQVLSLRKYLKTAPTSELERIAGINPEYYYTLAPYALALGVGKTFAKRFGKLHLPPCTYLDTGKQEESLTPYQWNSRMEQARERMNTRLRGMRQEQLLRFLQNLRK